MTTYQNPILPGFYPDPSICRKDDDFYLVNSTFAYFPGVPIFHSKDLVHWKQIGNIIDRKSQMSFIGQDYSQGIYAPTIRYHNGIFYMITTNVGGCGNFYMTATSPEGPWSDPIVVKGAGIDPTLFFDKDKAYYLGTREKEPAISRYSGDNEIWLQELDIQTGELLGEPYVIWEGAVKDAVWQEGPHIYKKDDYYYLLIAEGGTGLQHAIMIARSKNLFGPYENNPSNPILTHRHLGRYTSIMYVGHGDMVQAPDDSWWMVILASRPYGGQYSNMGRETFLVPVTWEDGWPMINKGKGCVEPEMEAPKLSADKYLPENVCDHFEKETLDFKWMCLRAPSEDMYSLARRKGYLSLKLRPETIFEKNNPSFIVRRQQHINYKVSTVLEFTPEHQGETAGIVLIQNENFNIRFERKIIEGKQGIVVTRREAGIDEVVGKCLYDKQKIYLSIIAIGEKLDFYYGEDEDCNKLLVEEVDATILASEVAGGFVGTCIGMYASSNHIQSQQYADFGWFEYIGLVR